MTNETIKHVSGDHVCWTRTLENGDFWLYTYDQKLKGSIMMSNVKYIDVLTDVFDDMKGIGIYGKGLMIAFCRFGHCMLGIDNELSGFVMLTSKHCEKYEISD